MDTQAEVPDFKIARVGKDRRRKGAGFPLFGGGAGSGAAWSGAVGGAGAGGVAAAGMTLTQALLALVATAALGSAGIVMGQRNAMVAKAAPKAKAFSQDRSAPVKIEGDTSNLPSNANTIPNSLGYLSGSMDGLTPEERAKKAAEAAEAQRVADAEAKKKADEEAAAAAKEQNADGAAADPAALLASAQADGGQQKAGGLGKRFGQLSSGLGGGSALSGGAGLSGGVNQSFSAASLGRGGDAGKITATRSAGKPSTSRAGRSSLASSRLKGFARQQLDNTNTLSRRGLAASKGETASFEAGTPFDNNSKGVENVISGPGVSKGAENSSGGPGANPVTNPGTGGGPTGDTPQCSGSQYPDPNTGSCVSTPEPQNKNVTPYQNLYNIAMGLLMLVTVLGVAALIFEKSAVPYLVAAAKMMKFAIMALGVIIAGLGVAILSMTGDKIAGGILTLTGGFIAATAMMMPKAVTAEVVKQVVIKTLIAATAGGFAAALAHKPAAAAD